VTESECKFLAPFQFVQKEKFSEMVNKSKVRRRKAALAAKTTNEDLDENLKTEVENSSDSSSKSSDGDDCLKTITEEAFEEDNTALAAAMADKDLFLKNTASAGTDDLTRVQSTILDVLMENDNDKIKTKRSKLRSGFETIKIEG
jgi:3-methyladenine DNA glycosylase AlkC